MTEGKEGDSLSDVFSKLSTNDAFSANSDNPFLNPNTATFTAPTAVQNPFESSENLFCSKSISDSPFQNFTPSTDKKQEEGSNTVEKQEEDFTNIFGEYKPVESSSTRFSLSPVNKSNKKDSRFTKKKKIRSKKSEEIEIVPSKQKVFRDIFKSETALQAACKDGDLSTVKLLLHNNEDNLIFYCGVSF